MRKMDKKSTVRQAKSLMKSRELTEALSGLIEKQRGDLGFLLSTLKKRPRTFNPYVLKGMSIYSEPFFPWPSGSSNSMRGKENWLRGKNRISAKGPAYRQAGCRNDIHAN